MRKWFQQLLTIEHAFHYSNIRLIISSRNACSLVSCNSTPKQARTSLATRALQHVFITHLTWRTIASAQSSTTPRYLSSSSSSEDQDQRAVGGVGDMGPLIEADAFGSALTARSSGRSRCPTCWDLSLHRSQRILGRILLIAGPTTWCRHR